MSDFFAYLAKNKEWIFSGIGVVVVFGIIRFFLRLATNPTVRRLSEAEREILFESAQDGEVRILKVDAFGSWVRAGKKDFFDKKDPAVQARYLEAFDSLCRYGLVRHEGGMLYRLTHSGFEVARPLAKQKDQNTAASPTES